MTLAPGWESAPRQLTDFVLVDEANMIRPWHSLAAVSSVPGAATRRDAWLHSAIDAGRTEPH
jgi:hypothetical protein